MHVLLPADRKCFHGRPPQTHFCLCLMDGYDRSSLSGIHQALFADAVDTPWDPGRFFIDIVQCPVCEDILPSPGIDQM